MLDKLITIRWRRTGIIPLLMGFYSPPAASSEREPEALYTSDDVTDRTSIYGGRPPRHSEVLGGSPTKVGNAQDRPLHGSCLAARLNVNDNLLLRHGIRRR